MSKLCSAQENFISQNNDTTVYSIVDELPAFPGGDSLLTAYISNDFLFQSGVNQSGVLLQSLNIKFIVTKEGKIKDVEITHAKTGSTGLDIELRRLFEKMPIWIPGKINGKPVNTNYSLDLTIGRNGQVHLHNAGLKAKADEAYNSGVKKSQEKNYQGAVDDFTETLKYNPKDIDALYNRGVMKLKLQDMEGACADWNAIKTLGKNDADELLTKYCANK